MTQFRRLRNLFVVSLRNFSRFRLQSALVIFAATMGVSGVIVSAGYAESGRLKIVDRFERLGTNVVTVSPLQGKAVGGRARTGTIVQTLSEQDYRAITSEVDGIDGSSGTITGVFRLRAGDLTKSSSVVGCEPDYFHMKHWSVSKGALFGNDDVRRQSRLALLGYGVAKDLFGIDDPSGQRISINKVPFVVVGVLAERGQGLDAANEDDQVYIPISSAMHRLMNADYYGSFLFELRDGSLMNNAVAWITSLVHTRHHRFSTSGDDFQVQNQKALIDAQLAAFARLSFLIGWIAASMLFVAALGIWGITWIGLRNRIREIGARRAIGARRLDVLIQFLVESMTGALIGCILAFGVSYGALRLLDEVSQQPFIFEVSSTFIYMAGGAALFATFVAMASGRAAFLNPINALRTE